ncbi:hypothetical protein Nepgr_006355 [Nepenthes gracilis]|uniref:Polygalacturonase n=1 Tax=Nepenthes gracilis TaxID=150966 RepID=A0AAD3XHC0_NEPGR|nr:hypothetical protein Nepgr_006355 [Nepenthes gracilis]
MPPPNEVKETETESRREVTGFGGQRKKIGDCPSTNSTNSAFFRSEVPVQQAAQSDENRQISAARGDGDGHATMEALDVNDDYCASESVVRGAVMANLVLEIGRIREGNRSCGYEELNNLLSFWQILLVVEEGGEGSRIGRAFLDAWNAACSVETDQSAIIIPRKQFLINPIVFHGPCKAKTINFQILGKILAPTSPFAWQELDPSQWLVFKGVSGLNVYGSGTIHGRGSGWWNQSCRYRPHLALEFLSCNDTTLSDVHLTDNPQTHITTMGCNIFVINSVSISAPENSPNTDGIHLQHAQNVIITDTRIGTGDDCVSIGDYTSNVNIFNITCRPGHGIRLGNLFDQTSGCFLENSRNVACMDYIVQTVSLFLPQNSIGSLGRGGNFVQVENIFVKNVYLKGTTNGARIKTWQVGRGHVRRVIFENLYFNSVKNPIIIDQNYCDVRGACKEKESGVWIKDVTYKGFYGTTSSDLAINLNCSHSAACTGVILESIVLWSAELGKEVASYCNNAYGAAEGIVQPKSCLQEWFTIRKKMRFWTMNITNK